MSLDTDFEDTEVDTHPRGAADTLLSRVDRAAVFLMLLNDDEATSLLGRLSPPSWKSWARR